MSHFVGLVFGEDVESLVSPYDQNLEVEPYIVYTKEGAIDKVKISRAINYEAAIRRAEKYKTPCNSIEEEMVVEEILKEANEIIEKGLFISYEDAWEKAKNWGFELDDEENLLDTYNLNSRWDWYSEGGEWGAWLILKEKLENRTPLTATTASKEDIDWDAMADQDRIPHCFVTKDGEWHEAVTEWGYNPNKKKLWKKEFLDYLKTVDNSTKITVIDFHI